MFLLIFVWFLLECWDQELFHWKHSIQVLSISCFSILLIFKTFFFFCFLFFRAQQSKYGVSLHNSISFLNPIHSFVFSSICEQKKSKSTLRIQMENRPLTTRPVQFILYIIIIWLYIFSSPVAKSTDQGDQDELNAQRQAMLEQIAKAKVSIHNESCFVSVTTMHIYV